MFRVLRSFLAVAAASACFWAGSAVAAYSLSFDPAAQVVGLGSEATVAVRIGNVQPDGLGAYDFGVSFDPGILAFDRAIDGLGLGLAVGLGATPGAGSVTLADFSLETVADLLALQGNNLVLFSLVFDTVGVGVSALGFEQVTLGDAAANPVTADALRAGSITVQANAAPEPGALALVGVALLAGAVVGKGRRR